MQFQRVAQAIRERIASGVYPVASRLPSIGALADEFDTSHMTVKQALSSLREEGLVATRRGVRTEVVAKPSGEEPRSVAERLGAVEDALAMLEQRVDVLDGHASKSTRTRRNSP